MSLIKKWLTYLLADWSWINQINSIYVTTHSVSTFVILIYKKMVNIKTHVDVIQDFDCLFRILKFHYHDLFFFSQMQKLTK